MIDVALLVVALVAFVLAFVFAHGSFAHALVVGLAALTCALLVERLAARRVVRR